MSVVPLLLLFNTSIIRKQPFTLTCPYFHKMPIHCLLSRLFTEPLNCSSSFLLSVISPVKYPINAREAPNRFHFISRHGKKSDWMPVKPRSLINFRTECARSSSLRWVTGECFPRMSSHTLLKPSLGNWGVFPSNV